MKTATTTHRIIHRANERGHTAIGWLDSRHSFSFGSFHDPQRMGFGALRVLNDDRIDGGSGFPPHPHRDMEIVSVVLRGGLAHRDSAGHSGTIHRGEVQFMSAGTGVVHSEFNASETEPGEFLQIWIKPRERGLAPVYAQKSTGWHEAPTGQWTQIAAEDGAQGALDIRQRARLAIVRLSAGQPFSWSLADGQGAYLFVIDGELEADGEPLAGRDALAVAGQLEVTGKAQTAATLLVIEVPMLAG